MTERPDDNGEQATLFDLLQNAVASGHPTGTVDFNFCVNPCTDPKSKPENVEDSDDEANRLPLFAGMLPWNESTPAPFGFRLGGSVFDLTPDARARMWRTLLRNLSVATASGVLIVLTYIYVMPSLRMPVYTVETCVDSVAAAAGEF
mgnify:FL=1